MTVPPAASDLPLPAPAPSPATPATWLGRALGAPLLVKLVGANAFVAAAAALALVAVPHAAADGPQMVILTAALALALVLDGALVALALRPVRDVEAVAARVWLGDMSARVVPSAVADADTARLGRTMNLLLDRLAADRDHMRALAAQTIRAQDEERSRIARELHDSAAQGLAALGYQLTAAARDAQDPALAERLGEMRVLLGSVLEEIRSLSHTIHPRVLEDLGLVAALEWLARGVRERSAIAVRLLADPAVERVGTREATAALYRVAQESLRNVERHANARSVVVSLGVAGDMLTLDVEDDGVGFSLADAERRRPGMGLFAMRERASLADGHLVIDAAPGRGTHVRATVARSPRLATE